MEFSKSIDKLYVKYQSNISGLVFICNVNNAIADRINRELELSNNMSICRTEILGNSRDFTFIDEEFRVQVGGEDYKIDLLFFHRGLQCLVTFELKIGKFKPEYISKMDFYLEALDRQKKKDNENPSVGMILCASKEDEVVEYE